MELYLVSFYDNNESGNVEHNEMYTTYAAAERRFNTLKNKLNGYSLVYLFDTIAKFGRVRTNECLDECRACYGKDGYYHGDDSDF